MKMYNNFLFVLLVSLFWACSPKITDVVTSDHAIEGENISAAEAKMKADDHGEMHHDMHSTPMHSSHDVQQAIPTDSRLRVGKLPNGIHYYIQQNDRPEDRAELRLAIHAGSILEDEDQRGLAHFVEHMAFNGTEHFEKSKLIDYLESVGSKCGPDLNAYTSFDETVYMLQVRTDSAELFDKGMLILRDWAYGVSFDDEEIDKERGVVESEWRTSLSPDQRMQQKTFPVLYQGSQYAQRLPIGDPEVIRHASYETVKRYYKDWYRSDLMAVVVVGNIDVDAVEGQIKMLFGDIPKSENARERQKYAVPFHDETLVAIASDKEASFTQLQLVYKHPKIHTKTIDDYRSSLVRSLYNTMMGDRLQEISKSADPPFVFAFSGYSGDVGDIDTYSSFAFIPEGKAAVALETILTENRRVLLHGYTEGEFERAKKNLMEGAEKRFKEMDKTESGRLAMQYVYKYLDEIPTPGPDQSLELYKQFLPTIELDEVNALASKWIRNNSRVVILTGPEKESAPMPTESEVKNILQRVDMMAVDAYEDEVISTPLFDETLSPVEIVKTKTYDDVGIEYIQLANGVEVYLKKTDFKNDEILMSAMSPGGSSIYGDEDYFDASQSGSIVSEAGVGDFSPTQLDKLLAGKTVHVRPYVGSRFEGMSGSVSPDDLEILFQLVYKYFKDPRVDEEAFESFITKQKGIFKNLMSNPQYFFSNYVSQLKYNNHPRVAWPTEADWAELNYEDVMKFYRERFADASDFTFSFVGNFDREKILAFIQTYLGNLPSIERGEKWKDVGIRPVKGVVKDRFNNGEAPKTNVHMFFHGDYEWSKNNNYLLNSTIAYLNIKLREALREDLGGVYGVRIGGGGIKEPYEHYGITISFNADPEMADKLVEAAHSVLKKAMTEGPDAEDMTKVKEIQRQSRTKNLKENRFWQGQIRAQMEEPDGFEDVLLEDYEKHINALTAHQIKHAVGKYFNYDQYFEVIMDPDKEKE